MEGNESTGASEASEASEEVAAGPEGVEATEEAVAELYKVMINGDEKEVDMETLIRDYQTGRAAQERFREASDIKRKADTSLSNMKDNPWQALQELGLNPLELSTSFLENHLKMEEMSEDERAEEHAKTEFQKQKEAFEKERAEYEEEKLAKAQDQEEKFYSNQIQKAIDDYNLPQSPRTTQRMAQLMLNNIESGFELPIEHIAEIVKEDYISEMKDIFGGASGDQILSLLGGDLSDKIRKTDIAKLKKGESIKKEVVKEEGKEENPFKKRKNESTADFFARMRD